MRRGWFHRTIRIIFAGTILIGFSWLLVRSVDMHAVFAAGMRADWGLIAAALVAVPVGLLLRAWRWKAIIDAHRSVGFWNVLLTTGVSRALAGVLPFRAADLVQGLQLSAREALPPATVLASVAVERVIDALFLCGFLGVLALAYPLSPAVKTAGLIAGASLCLGIVVAVKHTDYLVRRIERWSPGIARQLSYARDGIRIFSHRSLGVRVALLTLTNWLLAGLQVVLLCYAFAVPWSPAMILAYLVLPSLVTVVPSSPGFIGIWDYAAVTTLTAFGMAREQATSLSLVLHGINILGPGICGMYLLAHGWAQKRWDERKGGNP